MGRGSGVNEVYLTQTDGSLTLILNHGLENYPSMRSREIKVLKAANGDRLVFVSTYGGERDDGLPNDFRLYQRVVPAEAGEKYFEDLDADFLKGIVTDAPVIIVDLDDNGYDDIVLSDNNKTLVMFLQSESGVFTKHMFDNNSGPNHYSKNWHSFVFADATGDGLKDAVACMFAFGNRKVPYCMLFEGIRSFPYINMSAPLFMRAMTKGIPTDLVVHDVTGDGIADMYIVQTFHGLHGNGIPSLNAENAVDFPCARLDYMDPSPDVLMVGRGGGSFDEVEVHLNISGCGFYVAAFGESTLALSHGGKNYHGNNYLLRWPTAISL